MHGFEEISNHRLGKGTALLKKRLHTCRI